MEKVGKVGNSNDYDRQAGPADFLIFLQNHEKVGKVENINGFRQ